MRRLDGRIGGDLSRRVTPTGHPSDVKMQVAPPTKRVRNQEELQWTLWAGDQKHDQRDLQEVKVGQRPAQPKLTLDKENCTKVTKMDRQKKGHSNQGDEYTFFLSEQFCQDQRLDGRPQRQDAGHGPQSTACRTWSFLKTCDMSFSPLATTSNPLSILPRLFEGWTNILHGGAVW